LKNAQSRDQIQILDKASRDDSKGLRKARDRSGEDYTDENQRLAANY